MTDSIRELSITRLGARADGIADTPDGPVYVSYTLPGERIRASVTGQRGVLEEIVEPAAGRTAPLCRHFATCGGCATQHWSREAEQRWKASLVATAFSQQGIEAPMRRLVPSAPRTRRRAVFSARRTKAGTVFGFHAPLAHEIVGLAECPVLMNEISERIEGLRTLVTPLLSRSGEARITVTMAANGIDVAIEDAKPGLSIEDRGAVAVLAGAARIIRLSIDGDRVYESAEPHLRFGRAAVVPPPGAFLQAVPAMEAAMSDLIVSAAGKAKRIADLFCGLGTFTFPLAAGAEVLAADSDKASIAALADAARRTQGLKPITTKVRDLFGEPLSAKELEPFDAVVFDPPRAGADAQARMIAKSKVKTVIAVSCAPGTLARDAATLIAGGYELQSVTPVDQFVFSPHVEAIAILRRPKR